MLERLEAKKKVKGVEYHWLLMSLASLKIPKHIVVNIINLKQEDHFNEHLLKYTLPLYRNDLFGIADVYILDYKLTVAEKRQHVDFLDKQYYSWLDDLFNIKQKDKIIHKLRKEVECYRSKLDKYTLKYNITGNRKKYRDKLMVLYSRFCYILAKQHFEALDTKYYFIEFGTRTVAFDAPVYAHILFRHYGAGLHLFDTGKSFHSSDSDYKNINLELENVFSTLASNGFSLIEPISYLPVRLRGTKKAICTKKLELSLKGKGKVNVDLITSYYPIEVEDNLRDLDTRYEEVVISDELSVFILNPPT